MCLLTKDTLSVLMFYRLPILQQILCNIKLNIYRVNSCNMGLFIFIDFFLFFVLFRS